MAKERMNKYLILIALLIIPFTSATIGYGDIDYGIKWEPEDRITTFDNNTANVNNSQHLQGYTPETLKDWIQSAFNSVYCKLTGCSMTGDLDTTGDIEADTFTLDGTSIDNWDDVNGSGTDSNIYKIYFSHSMNNIITYNLTEADASIITINTVGGQKEIYGGEF